MYMSMMSYAVWECARLEIPKATLLASTDRSSMYQSFMRTVVDAGYGEYIEEGKIVVSETTVGLLRKAMSQSDGPFLIDGFPRSMSNLHAFEAELGPCEYMLFLEVALARCIAAPAPRVARLRGPVVRARALARVRAPLRALASPWLPLLPC